MRILRIITVMVLWTGGAYAATIDLNDGRSVQGDIVKKDSKSLQVSVDGINMTYYADEIKDIDGQPFGQAGVSEAAPAAQPETQSPAQAAPAAVQAPVPAVMPGTTAQPAPPSPPATGQAGEIDPEKKALILKFIDVFGTRQALNHNFDAMVQDIEKEKPEEAQKIRQRVNIDEIIDRLLPIYDRNFTTEDLKAFIAFYSSPEGQKLIGTIPELMKESVAESVKYMQEKFPEIKGEQ